MLALWFVTGFFAGGSPGTEEPPPDPPVETANGGGGGGSQAPVYRYRNVKPVLELRNIEEVEALLLTSAI